MASIKCGHCTERHSTSAAVFICAHIYGVLAAPVDPSTRAALAAFENAPALVQVLGELLDNLDLFENGADVLADEDSDGEYDGPDDRDVDWDFEADRAEAAYTRGIYGD